MANSNTEAWTVKVTGLPSSISAKKLADELSIEEDRVSFPVNQDQGENNYAWINGFDNEEEAHHYATLWNRSTILDGEIRCSLNQSDQNFSQNIGSCFFMEYLN